MADTTLERIDATLNQSCACGCGRLLDPDGPSAWWATEGCFKVGTRALTGADHPEIIGRSLRTTPLPTVTMVELTLPLAALADAFDEMVNRLNEAFAALDVTLDRQTVTVSKLLMLERKAAAAAVCSSAANRGWVMLRTNPVLPAEQRVADALVASFASSSCRVTETVAGQRGDDADKAKTPANVQESGGARRERVTAQPPDLTPLVENGARA